MEGVITMLNISREEFLMRSNKTLGDIYDLLSNVPSINLKDLPSEKTAFVIVDMINGFAREGALKSPRVEAIIDVIANVSKACDKLGIKKIAFADTHTDKSPEFGSYPVHCIEGSSEAEVVDEIKSVGGYLLIAKNSTNGFLEDEFQNWLKNNPEIDNFVVVGDCTDICVNQFAVTLKTWFNKQNKSSRIIVPSNAVDTYDLGAHNGDLMQVMALFSMMGNGIEIVNKVEL